MLDDQYGNSVSTDSAACIAALDAYVEDMLGLRDGVAALLAQALNADPDCALVLTHQAALMLFMDAEEGYRRAGPILQRARQRVRYGTERERLFLAAVEAWHQQAPGRQLAIHRQLAERYPSDLFALKLGQIHCLYLGEFSTMLMLGQAAISAHPGDAFAHGMMAFALEEADRLDEAERHARTALDLRRVEPWAQHALAHVFEARGRAWDGLAFLGGVADSWEICNSFAYTHNWWHMALFHLDLDEAWRAREIYDRHIWSRQKDYSQDQLNAISLLIRLEVCAGLDVGRRWADLAQHLKPRIQETILPFNDLHYILGLAKGGLVEQADAKLARLKADATLTDLYVRRSWQEVAVPVGEGLLAYARGAFLAAADHLAPVIGRVQELGGSHAQRDMFHLIYLDALIKGGRKTIARTLLNRRAADKPNVSWIAGRLASLSSP